MRTTAACALFVATVMVLGYLGASRVHRARALAQRCDAKHGYGGWRPACWSQWLMVRCDCEPAP